MSTEWKMSTGGSEKYIKGGGGHIGRVVYRRGGGFKSSARYGWVNIRKLNFT